MIYTTARAWQRDRTADAAGRCGVSTEPSRALKRQTSIATDSSLVTLLETVPGSALNCATEFINLVNKRPRRGRAFANVPRKFPAGFRSGATSQERP